MTPTVDSSEFILNRYTKYGLLLEILWETETIEQLESMSNMSDMEEQLEARPSDFDAIYESIKNSPEAVKELADIMSDTIEKTKAVVGKYEALKKSYADTVPKEVVAQIEEEEYNIEAERLDRITDLLRREVERKESVIKSQEEDVWRLTQMKYRLENNNRKIYPNDPCQCGSGLKYKKCCGKAGK